MTITSLAVQARRSERVSLFIDGEYRFSLSLNLLASLGLKAGQSLTAEELDALRRAATLDDAKTAICAMLARRAHSRKELAQKLRRKGFSKDIIEEALAEADAQRLIDDRAFAESFVRRRLRQTQLGARKLQAELYQKGVSRSIVKQALSNAENDDESLCRAAAEKKWKTLQKESDAQKRRRKLFDFLLRRGFEWDVIQRATATLLRASDLER